MEGPSGEGELDNIGLGAAEGRDVEEWTGALSLRCEEEESEKELEDCVVVGSLGSLDRWVAGEAIERMPGAGESGHDES